MINFLRFLFSVARFFRNSLAVFLEFFSLASNWLFAHTEYVRECLYGFSLLTLVALPNLVNPMVNHTTKKQMHTHAHTYTHQHWNSWNSILVLIIFPLHKHTKSGCWCIWFQMFRKTVLRLCFPFKLDLPLSLSLSLCAFAECSMQANIVAWTWTWTNGTRNILCLNFIFITLCCCWVVCVLLLLLFLRIFCRSVWFWCCFLNHRRTINGMTIHGMYARSLMYTNWEWRSIRDYTLSQTKWNEMKRNRKTSSERSGGSRKKTKHGKRDRQHTTHIYMYVDVSTHLIHI